MKTCTRCQLTLPFNAFYKDLQKKSGLSPQCKTCRKLPPRYATLEERFWAKVDKTSSPNGCWLWTAALWPNGYGHFVMPTHHALAHRVSWELINGPIPDETDVLHNCPNGDNKACLNPEHLWLGTQHDNALDAVKKGQFGNALFKPGPQHPFYGQRKSHCKNGHKLTPENTRMNRNGKFKRCKTCDTVYHRNKYLARNSHRIHTVTTHTLPPPDAE